MLPAFNMLAASVLALVWLTVGLLFPILAVWFGVRVARDLRRIADSLEVHETLNVAAAHLSQDVPYAQVAERERRIVNSMFGR